MRQYKSIEVKLVEGFEFTNKTNEFTVKVQSVSSNDLFVIVTSKLGYSWPEKWNFVHTISGFNDRTYKEIHDKDI